jgi:hypothetical protein
MAPGRQHLNPCRDGDGECSVADRNRRRAREARRSGQPAPRLRGLESPGQARRGSGRARGGLWSVQDTGNGKTWKIDVNVSGCADFREIQIFNRAGNARSSPLAVTLLRDPAEEVCVGGASGPIYGSCREARPGNPVNSKPSGPCAGGAAERVFNVCENCANLTPAVGQRVHRLLGVQLERRAGRLSATRPGDHEAAALHDSTGASREACEGP